MKFSPSKMLPLVGAAVLSTLVLGGSPASALDTDNTQLCIATYEDFAYNPVADVSVLVIADDDVDCSDLLTLRSNDSEEELDRWNHCSDKPDVCTNVLNQIAAGAGILPYQAVVRSESASDQCIDREVDDEKFVLVNACKRTTYS